MFHITSNSHSSFDAIFSRTASPSAQTDQAVPISALTNANLKSWLDAQSQRISVWVAACNFTANPGQVCMIADKEGNLAQVLLGLGEADPAMPYITGALPPVLPQGLYRFDELSSLKLDQAVLGWAVGHYKFSRYKDNGAENSKDGKSSNSATKLLLPDDMDTSLIEATVEAVFLTRDLVNTPANDMGPADLEAAAQRLADHHKAKMSVVHGDDLLDQNYPLIHAVGRAAKQAPRLIDIEWGDTSAPKVTLVGKGVCFDTGGLNLKPGSAMGLMKKDMGGAAHVLGLAHMIVTQKLPIRLRVLIPAVENSVSDEAFRPGDIYPSRKGLSVEIGNTDAEGRLVLADALALACEEDPALIIDMATLTGAARTALGPDLPPFYTDNSEIADALSDISVQLSDPLWRMPLWPGYRTWLDSPVANVNHISDGPFAGSITAALFLKRFVRDSEKWLHFDVYAWCPKAKPGQMVGGEAQGIRTLFAFLKTKFAT